MLDYTARPWEAPIKGAARPAVHRQARGPPRGGSVVQARDGVDRAKPLSTFPTRCLQGTAGSTASSQDCRRGSPADDGIASGSLLAGPGASAPLLLAAKPGMRRHVQPRPTVLTVLLPSLQPLVRADGAVGQSTPPGGQHTQHQQPTSSRPMATPCSSWPCREHHKQPTTSTHEQPTHSQQQLTQQATQQAGAALELASLPRRGLTARPS